MPATTEKDITNLALTFDGADLDPSVYADLLFTNVESRLDMPAQAIIEFADDRLKYIDEPRFQIG